MIINENCESCKALAEKLKEYDEVFEGHAAEVTDLELKLCDKSKECEEWKNKYYASTTEVKADLIKQLDELKETFNNAIELSKIYKKQIFKSSEKALKYSQALQEIKELVKKDYCSEIESCEFCAEIGNCINRKILQKCEVLDEKI